MVGLSVALLSSCTQLVPESESQYIRFSTSIVDTKAVLTPDDIEDGTGTKLTVYDILPGVKDNSNKLYKWIPGYTATFNIPYYDTSDDGTPVNNIPWLYNSTERVDHLFFGWLTYDKYGRFMWNATVSENSDGSLITYTTEARTLELNYDNFDFCYAEPVFRSAAESNYSAVNLELNHFFTCFGIKATNYTTNNISIKSINLYGLWNTKTGTMTYDVHNHSVACACVGDAAMATPFSLVGSTPIALAVGATVDNVITSTGLATDKTDAFFINWPQSASELDVPTTWTDKNTKPASGAFLEIKYSEGGGADKIVYVPLRPESWKGPDGRNTIGWDKGTKHHIELAFSNESVTLTAAALPWDHVTPEISYERSITVVEEGRLTLNTATCSVDEANRRVYFKNGMPITITFRFDQPLDATWLIEKKGDFDAFEIDNATLVNGAPISLYGDGFDYNYGTIDGNTAIVTLFPNVRDTKVDREITLSFSVRSSNGTVTSADDQIQPGTPYTFVIQAS